MDNKIMNIKNVFKQEKKMNQVNVDAKSTVFWKEELNITKDPVNKSDMKRSKIENDIRLFEGVSDSEHIEIIFIEDQGKT